MADEAQEHSVVLALTNRGGLHARPCHALASLALGFDAAIEVRVRHSRADGKSILSLMTLGACLGDELELRAQGVDAREAIEALAALVAQGFGEA